VIKMMQPSLVIHSCDVPGFKYQMWATWNAPEGMNAIGAVNWIASAVDRSPDMELKNVIINSHGDPGVLYLGGKDDPTIDIGCAGAFSQLRAKDIGTIWLVACEVAKDSAGRAFCTQLAINAGCDVVAADEEQIVEGAFYDSNTPWGCIDEFEGNVYRFDAAGNVQSYNPHSDIGTGS